MACRGLRRAGRNVYADLTVRHLHVGVMGSRRPPRDPIRGRAAVLARIVHQTRRRRWRCLVDGMRLTDCGQWPGRCDRSACTGDGPANQQSVIYVGRPSDQRAPVCLSDMPARPPATSFPVRATPCPDNCCKAQSRTSAPWSGLGFYYYFFTKKYKKSSWNEPYFSFSFTKQSCSKMAVYR